MKQLKLLFFLVLFILPFCSNSQSQFQMVDTTRKSIGSLFSPATNGEYWLVDDSYSTPSGQSFTISRMDDDFDEKFATSYTIPGLSKRLQAVLALSNGDVVLAGTIQPSLSRRDSIFVLKVKSTGLPDWIKTMQIFPFEHQVANLFETTDGGIIVSGIVDSTSGTLLFASKLDASGNLVWSNKYETALRASVHRAAGVVEENNADLTFFAANMVFSEGSFIATLDSNGKVKTAKQIKLNGNSFGQHLPFKIFKRNGGGHDLFYRDNGLTDSILITVVRLNNTGAVSLVRNFSLNSAKGNALSVTRTTSGSYLVCGSLFAPSTFKLGDGLLFELDSNLNLGLRMAYGSNNIILPGNAYEHSHAGYILSGRADPNNSIAGPSENGLYPWLARTDNLGRTLCYYKGVSMAQADTTYTSKSIILSSNPTPAYVTSRAIQLSYRSAFDTLKCTPTNTRRITKDDIRLFPNPSNGLINLEFGSNNRSILIEIINPMGELIKEFNFSDCRMINCSLPVANGLYLIRINDGREIYLKRVIKI